MADPNRSSHYLLHDRRWCARRTFKDAELLSQSIGWHGPAAPSRRSGAHPEAPALAARAPVSRLGQRPGIGPGARVAYRPGGGFPCPGRAAAELADGRFCSFPKGPAVPAIPGTGSLAISLGIISSPANPPSPSRVHAWRGWREAPGPQRARSRRGAPGPRPAVRGPAARPLPCPPFRPPRSVSRTPAASRRRRLPRRS